MGKVADLVRDFYSTEHWIVGCQCGGIEAPHDILSVEEKDGKVIARWRNPETCGLSDVRYHYADRSVHEDVFTLENGVLSMNGKTALFNIDKGDEYQTEAAKRFINRWRLKNAFAGGI